MFSFFVECLVWNFDSLTRNLFDRSILWMATIPLCDKSSLHSVNAAKLVSDITGIFVNMLCDKSKLNQYQQKAEIIARE